MDPRDASRIDGHLGRELADRIALALLGAQTGWLVAGDRAALRRELLAILVALEV